MTIFLFVGNGGGGGGGGSQDRFAPKYVVGNVQNGDLAAAYATDGFFYIPDPGDGTGIATALGVGYAATVPGDVWIRPGTYDLTQPTSPIAPFAVPTGVIVRGAGNSTLILGRLSGDQRVFDLALSAELRDLRINVIGELSGTGPGVIICAGGSSSPSRVDRVDVQLVNTGGVGSTLRAAVYSEGFATVAGCRFFLSASDPQTFTGGIAAVVSSGSGYISATRCVVAKVFDPYDSGFVAQNNSALQVSECRVLGASLAGVFVGGGTGKSRVSVSECDIPLSGGATCVLSDSYTRVSDCTLTNVGGNTILSTGAGVITGNTISGNVDTSGGLGHVITSNLLFAGSTITTSASDEDAHNITL